MADIITALNLNHHQRTQLAALLARTEAAIARAAAVLSSLDARYLADSGDSQAHRSIDR
jgi:hypothetical protein